MCYALEETGLLIPSGTFITFYNPRLAYRAEKYAIGMPKTSGKTPGYADKAEEETLRALAECLLVHIR